MRVHKRARDQYKVIENQALECGNKDTRIDWNFKRG